MATKKGICILCQQEKELNLEHVPPQGVGNKGGKNTLTRDLEDFLSWDFSGKSLPREIKRQPKENVYYTLCIECNSKLGGAYVKHYVDFVKENKEFLYRIKNVKNGKNSILTHSINNVNPLRVAKEIVAMFFV
ncbi:HNH endonuclease [Lactococcus lactis]|uniref:HNH endonuclease n=1 Tax=Lactococcus lactis TaxID=1358 RepID=UPI00223B5A99|nr:HNH endonuclease [Lactococcus lactis]